MHQRAYEESQGSPTDPVASTEKRGRTVSGGIPSSVCTEPRLSQFVGIEGQYGLTLAECFTCPACREAVEGLHLTSLTGSSQCEAPQTVGTPPRSAEAVLARSEAESHLQRLQIRDSVGVVAGMPAVMMQLR